MFYVLVYEFEKFNFSKKKFISFALIDKFSMDEFFVRSLVKLWDGHLNSLPSSVLPEPEPVLPRLSKPAALVAVPPIVEPLLLLLLAVCPIMLNSVTNKSSSCARANKLDDICFGKTKHFFLVVFTQNAKQLRYKRSNVR